MKKLLGIGAAITLFAFSSCIKTEVTIGKTINVKVIKEIYGNAASEIVGPAYYDFGGTVVCLFRKNID